VKKALEPEHSISIYPGNGTFDGRIGDHVMLSPPYTVTAHDIREIARITGDVIEDFFRNMTSGTSKGSVF
jgi:adenosylmethionine-8-amino-7-oxononanoate aminotransferase